MSIADTITSIETHIGDAYDTLELGGADLTNVNKNIQNITPQLKARYLDFMNNGTDTVWNNWEKVTGTGTSVSLNNVVQAPMKIDTQGNTIQDGTPTPATPVPINSVGDNVNLIQIEDGTYTATNNLSSITFKNGIGKINIDSGTNADFGIRVPITPIILKANQSYSRTVFQDLYPYMTLYGVNNKTIDTMSNADNNFKVYTPDEDKDVRYIYLWINYKGVYGDIKPKLSLGSYKKDNFAYSPYNMGAISIEKCNKNLFDGANPVYVANKVLNDSGVETADSTGGYTKMYISVEPNTTYTISGMPEYGSKRIYYFNKSKLFISRTDRFGTTYNTFTTPSNCYYVDFQYFIEGNDFTDYQLELGSTPTTYVAHQSTTYPIYTQAPMRAIGDVRDDFIKQAGVWYERHKIGTYNLNGTENWYIATQTHNTYTRFRIDSTMIVPSALRSTNAFCNFFQFGDTGSDTEVNLLDWRANGLVMINTNVASTVADLKTWLSTHNTEVIYELAEPTLTECTNEQVSQLENIVKAKSYNGQTNLFSNDKVEPYLNCVALKNI